MAMQLAALWARAHPSDNRGTRADAADRASSRCLRDALRRSRDVRAPRARLVPRSPARRRRSARASRSAPIAVARRAPRCRSCTRTRPATSRSNLDVDDGRSRAVDALIGAVVRARDAARRARRRSQLRVSRKGRAAADVGTSWRRRGGRRACAPQPAADAAAAHDRAQAPLRRHRPAVSGRARRHRCAAAGWCRRWRASGSRSTSSSRSSTTRSTTVGAGAARDAPMRVVDFGCRQGLPDLRRARAPAPHASAARPR